MPAASSKIRSAAQRDERGYYWFRPDHLELVRRARDLVEARQAEERLPDN